MRIDDYQFGQVKIEGKEYRHDVIIYPGRVEKWWRQEGHKVYPEDIKEVVKEKPTVLIIGTGHSGLVEVMKETREYLAQEGIELIAEPTTQAVEIYNQLAGQKKVIAALHLTC